MSDKRGSKLAVGVIFKYWVNSPEAWMLCLHKGCCMVCGQEGPLDRAHIKATVLGGPDVPENVHLLCRRCHKMSELLEGEDYWDWVKTHDLFRVIKAEAAKWGLSLDKVSLAPVDKHAKIMEEFEKVAKGESNPIRLMRRLKEMGVDARI
jgi:hypothetical protein